ncbi:glycine/D-amino acid oxidase-like deaminating enzyme [Streptomyces sp. 3211.6]|uniref:NAD(P)/FAD-dependent oxidoreductase n=1 Tax=Streptomyces sp. 3211.6 TaxID=1938845 RepID=UPI000C2BDFB1|nr:FAD-dependent oxidoreductase [Streptomyces sp. 3211.6]RKT08292.1 glycine/D-amino acid oxidase-like deaminating enzyme [Streptomyces sp. 3211.6]
MDSPRPDVIVVGNGAVGSSVAFELVRRGHSVTRIGAEGRPFAASSAAGAMLGCFGEVTSSMLATPSGRAKLATDYRARAEWPDWDRELAAASGSEETLFTADGTVVVLNTAGTAAVDSANFRAIETALREYREPHELIDPEELDWFSPDELARALRGIHLPGEHAVDAHRLLAKLDQAFSALGGETVDAEADAVEVRRGRVLGVRLTDGRLLPCGQVVVAAGARSLELLGQVEDLRRQIPPMVSGYGVSALVETPDRSLPRSVLRSPNRAFACGIHCVPRSEGTLYVGGTNVLSEHPRKYATVRDLQFLLECAVDQLYSGLPRGAVRAVQVGNRPVPVDGFPLVGSAGMDGLWLATGTYRDGLHQSPLLAKHMATSIEDGRPLVAELAAFTPVRAPLPSGTRQEILDSVVDQMMASGYETRWRVTPEWPERMEEQLRRSYADTIDALHPCFTPPAEFIPKLNDTLRNTLSAYYKAWS